MPTPVISPTEIKKPAGPARLLESEDWGTEVFFDPSVLPLVTGGVAVFEDFLALLTQDVQRERLAVARIEVRGTSDPEDDTSQILVRLWLNRLSDQEARDYYCAFGRRVDDWASHLNDEQRQFFMTKVSFQTRRVTDA